MDPCDTSTTLLQSSSDSDAPTSENTNNSNALNFAAPSGKSYANFLDGCRTYCENMFPEMAKDTKSLMIPSVFRFRFNEPTAEQASGHALRLKSGTKAHLEGDIAEQIVYEALEKYGQQLENRKIIVLRQFCIDDARGRLLSKIWPVLGAFRIEIDFLVFYDRVGVLLVETKARSSFELKRLSEARAQSGISANFIQTLAAVLFPESKLSCPIYKLVCYPHMTEVPADLDVQDVHLIHGSQSQSFDDIMRRTLDSFTQQPQTQTQTQDADGDSINVSVMDLARAVIGMSAIQEMVGQFVHLSKPLNVAHFIADEARRISEYSVVDSESEQLESKVVRAAKNAPPLKRCLNVYFLTPGQLQVWKTPQQIVIGPAGTGKTVLIMGKMLELAANAQDVLVLVPASISLKYNTVVAEQSGKVRERITICSDADLEKQLPELLQLSAAAVKVISEMFAEQKEERVANLQAMLATRRQIPQSWLGNSNSRTRSNPKILNGVNNKLDCLELLANWFSDALQSSKDQAASLPNLSNSDERYAELILAFHAAKDKWQMLISGKNFFVDDCFALGQGSIWIALSLILPHCDIPCHCWIAGDTMQLFLDDFVTKLYLSHLSAANELALSQRHADADGSEDWFLHEWAKTNTLTSLNNFTASLRKKTIFSILSVQCLNTVLRCTGKVFDAWKELYFVALSNTELRDSVKLAPRSLAVGHRFLGAQTELCPLLADGIITKAEKSDNLNFNLNLLVKKVAATIKYLLHKPESAESKSLRFSDFAVLFADDEQTVGNIVTYLRTALSESHAIATSSIGEHFTSNVVSVDFAKNAVSCEWAVVLSVDSLTGLIGFNRVLPYISSSRTMAKLFIIRDQFIGFTVKDNTVEPRFF